MLPFSTVSWPLFLSLLPVLACELQPNSALLLQSFCFCSSKGSDEKKVVPRGRDCLVSPVTSDRPSPSQTAAESSPQSVQVVEQSLLHDHDPLVKILGSARFPRPIETLPALLRRIF